MWRGEGADQTGTLINTAHTYLHTRAAGWNHCSMCAQHGLQTHTNTQLLAAHSECVIVTLWGSVSHMRVVN